MVVRAPLDQLSAGANSRQQVSRLASGRIAWHFTVPFALVRKVHLCRKRRVYRPGTEPLAVPLQPHRLRAKGEQRLPLHLSAGLTSAANCFGQSVQSLPESPPAAAPNRVEPRDSVIARVLRPTALHPFLVPLITLLQDPSARGRKLALVMG